jgi:hypothetical protein
MFHLLMASVVPECGEYVAIYIYFYSRNHNLKMCTQIQVDQLHQHPSLSNLTIFDRSVTHSLQSLTCVYTCLIGDHRKV